MQVSGLTAGVTDLGAGSGHSCAIVSRVAKCWGNNSYGQLGRGNTTSSRTPVDLWQSQPIARKIDAGGNNSCAIISWGTASDPGEAYCWGANSYGQVGNGTTSTRVTGPTYVASLTQDVTDIEIASSHACAVESGVVKCWGSNAFGQLGDGTTTSHTTPAAVTGLQSGATKVSVGGASSCAVVSGAVKCWGRNDDGQLGDRTTVNSTIPVQPSGLTSGNTAVSIGVKHACNVKDSGLIRCQGANTYGQGGSPTVNNYTRYVASISGSFAATYSSNGQIRYQIVNVRGDVVAEADNIGLQQVGPIDEFGVPEDGTLPQGRRYGFQGSHQREALTESGTVAMGVRLYVPRIGRFLQVDPVLGGTEGAYEYPSDPVNSSDLDGRKKKNKFRYVEYFNKKATRRMIRRLRNSAQRERDTAEMDAYLGGSALAIGLANGSKGLGLLGAGAGFAGWLQRKNAAAKYDELADALEDMLEDSGGRGVNMVFQNKTGNWRDTTINFYSRGKGDPSCGADITDYKGNVNRIHPARC